MTLNYFFPARKNLRLYAAFLSVMSLIGCDGFGRMTATRICQESPALCADLNTDGWCQSQRSKLIHHRFEHQQQETGRDKYFHMLHLENYKNCISNAAQIVHINRREKEGDRVRGLLTAERELNRLQKETAKMDDPYLYYYHWSRFGDQQAMTKFLDEQNKQQLETPQLQVALAHYYSKFNLPIARDTLFHALELYSEEDELDTSIFTSLTSIYLKLQEFDQAYIWAYIGRKNKVENIDLSAIELMLLQQQQDIDKLQDQAEVLLDSIEDREFISPAKGK